MTEVLVVGSINVDLGISMAQLPRPGETVVGGRFWQAQGGKGANQAVASARFGARTAMVGAIGPDRFGRVAVEGLSEAGVDVSWIQSVPDLPTGVAVILSADGGDNLIAVASGANAGISPGEVERAVRSLQPKVVLLSLELGDDAVLAAAAAAGTAGALLVLNPAPYRPIARQLAPAAAVITPNQGEAEELLGGPIDAGDLIERARSAGLGAADLVITLGDRGAGRLSGDEFINYPAKPVEPVDTTGAGDAFNGVLAASLSHGHEIDAAVRRAVAAGTLATLSLGGRAARASKEEVEAFVLIDRS